jgi:hypothetical protein
MASTPTDPLSALAAAIARLDAAGDTAGADQFIVLAMKGALASIALAFGAERVAQLVHRAAWPDGPGGPGTPAVVPAAAMVAGNPETDGPAARRLMRLALNVVEPMLGEEPAELLGGATVRLDQDAKAETVLTAGAATHIRGTPQVREEAVLATRLLARRILIRARAGGAKEWPGRLGLPLRRMRAVVPIELALLDATIGTVSPKTWDTWKLRLPPMSSLVTKVIVAVEQDQQLTPEQKAEVADGNARKVLTKVAAATDPDRPADKTLKYLTWLWQRANRK